MKRSLRNQIRRQLAELSPAEALARSRAACRHVAALDEFADAQSVMLYMPIPGELDVVPLALQAWQRGKTVLLPRVAANRRRMFAVSCNGLDDDMAEGFGGIREPQGKTVWPPDDIDMIIVPGLAFDKSGARLGRGGGFYDRFLAVIGLHAFTCGVAFGEQVVEKIPRADHDIDVHALATEEGVLRFRRGRA